MGKRIIIGIVLAVLFLTVLYFGAATQAALFTFAAMVAMHEMGRLIKKKGYAPFMLPAYAFVLVFAPWLYLLPDIPVTFLWMAAVITVLLERVLNRKRDTESSLLSLLPLVYPLPMFVVLVLFGVRFDSATGTSALLLAVACPLMGDTVAYFVGTFFGRHKLCPEISPKKTVEGSIASVAGSIAASIVIWYIQRAWGSSLPLAVLLAAGVLCGILGQIGDLFASILKRWADMKDYGALLPGHGGVMDRLDSVLMCAPVVYVCVYIASVL